MSNFMSFFVTKVTGEWGDTYVPTTAGFTALVIMMIAVLMIGCMAFGGSIRFSTKQLAFSAMAIALAFATSFIKIIHMPMGGSVTLFSMLFITLIGYWYGTAAGLTAACAYGFLQLVVDPYIISFPQMLVDYIFAFGALGLSGLFSKNKGRSALIFCYLAGVLGRYFFAFLSGYLFFATYTPEFFNSAIVYSLVYNGAYIGLEALITLVLLSLPPVSKALAHVKKIAKQK